MTEQGLVVVGKPAGMNRRVYATLAEAVPSSSQTPIQRAALRTSAPTRAKQVPDDHTMKVPVKSFQDDLQRKLKLKRVMGGEQQREERPPDGMMFLKEDVNYRYAADRNRACGVCKYFADGSCEIVSGLIRSVDTCDKFAPEDEGAVRATLVDMAEVTPPGYEPVVRALKKKFGAKTGTPWAVAWSMKNRGIKPRTAVRASLAGY
jgi:hypothetical protein